MKISMMTNNYKPFIGGVPISIERLSNGLKNNGHNVNIFAPTYQNQIEEQNVIRYCSFKKTLNNKMVIPNIFDLNIEHKFKQLNADVIHVHHPNFIGWTSLYLGKKYNIPVVYTYHTRYEHYIHNLTFLKNSQLRNVIKNKLVPVSMRHFINMCDRVIAPTNLMKNVLEDLKVSTPIDIIPTGVSDEFFEADIKEVEKIKVQYQTKYLICTVCRLSKEKNIDFILRATKILKERIGGDFKILIIGDGPEKENLINLANELNINQQIVWVGNVPNQQLKNYYSACDLFVFASKSETQGIVLLEAMASKLPVVAIEASGVIDIVENNKNGYMTIEDEYKWTNKIIDIIKNDKLCNALSNGALETAKDYTTNEIALQAETIYFKAIQNIHNKAENRVKAVNIWKRRTI
ncbi:hypothetical protein AN641_06715 [Candidatus Epulonipiscioides gigas]|nr:hypothetical protein AN641_06715 [Epulopiscium sp. SCG-C07WGA-EpuloA2]